MPCTGRANQCAFIDKNEQPLTVPVGRETKTVCLAEWLQFFSAALCGGIDGIDVDTEKTAMALDYLINEANPRGIDSLRRACHYILYYSRALLAGVFANDTAGALFMTRRAARACPARRVPAAPPLDRAASHWPAPAQCTQPMIMKS